MIENRTKSKQRYPPCHDLFDLLLQGVILKIPWLILIPLWLDDAFAAFRSILLDFGFIWGFKFGCFHALVQHLILLAWQNARSDPPQRVDFLFSEPHKLKFKCCRSQRGL